MWTAAALGFEARAWSGLVWRVVESQARVSTMKLVDTLAEQDLLERILDRGKPALPPEAAGLHYLLATPFRYAPYPNGSRFRRALQPEGCFYGAEAVATAIAEQAFYRLLFFQEAPTVPPPARATEHTAFAVSVVCDASLDLTAPPLSRDAPAWTHLTDYAACQDLADAARAGGIGALRYRSVRDPDGGMNVALLSPAAFATQEPVMAETWHLFVQSAAVQAFREMPRAALEFTRAGWSSDPRLADAGQADAGLANAGMGSDGGRDRD